MEIHDRGTKKWTAMMMPEQIQMLNEMWKQQEYKQKPMLDEQQLTEINTKLQCAIHNDLTVIIKHFVRHDYLTTKGKLVKIDSVNRSIQLHDEDRTKIALENVLDVYID